jgi:hypothetical protein
MTEWGHALLVTLAADVDAAIGQVDIGHARINQLSDPQTAPIQ